MTDNLRDRIAAVIRDHPQGQEWGIPDEECTQCPPQRGIDWAQHVADAVIAELGLQQEDGECGYCHAQLPGCRYVTEWSDDEVQ